MSLGNRSQHPRFLHARSDLPAKRHRAAYFDHLQAVRDRGDWEGWLAFFLRGVVEVSEKGPRRPDASSPFAKSTAP